MLRADSLAGAFGACLPGENELAVHYAVSRMTLRRAISALIEEGVLESRHSAGAYLRGNVGQSRTVGLVMAGDLAIRPHDCFHQQPMLYAAARWALRVAPRIEDLYARLGAERPSTPAACIADAFGGDGLALLAQTQLPLETIDGEPVAGRSNVRPHILTRPYTSGACFPRVHNQ